MARRENYYHYYYYYYYQRFGPAGEESWPGVVDSVCARRSWVAVTEPKKVEQIIHIVAEDVRDDPVKVGPEQA